MFQVCLHLLFILALEAILYIHMIDTHGSYLEISKLDLYQMK